MASRAFNGLHGVISQKTVLFITTCVTTWNSTNLINVYRQFEGVQNKVLNRHFASALHMWALQNPNFLQIVVFWVEPSCRFIDGCQLFGGTYCFQLQVDIRMPTFRRNILPTWRHITSSVYHNTFLNPSTLGTRLRHTLCRQPQWTKVPMYVWISDHHIVTILVCVTIDGIWIYWPLKYNTRKYKHL
jgi:hypothetical protein